MSAAIQAWLEQAANSRGLVACCFRQANRSLLTRSNSTDFPEPQMEQTVRKLFEAVYALQQNQIPTDRVCWSFETVQLQCIARPGGVMAVLLVDPEKSSPAEIERLLTAAPVNPA
ncbi:MAG: hypothetical protein U1F65_10240 [Verrucomicrobiota bacterium]